MVTIIPIVNWAFSVDSISLRTLLAMRFDGLAHLWFPWHLLLLAGALIIFARLGLKFGHAMWWLVIPLNVVPQHLMKEVGFGAYTCDRMIPASHIHGDYVVFFFFGVFLYQRKMEV